MSERTRFERLALPHLDAAYTLAYWLVGSRADAEDVVQDAYLRAFRSFSGFTGGDMRPWLLTIVRNVAYRALGTRKRSASVVSLDEAFSRRAAGEAAAPEPAADEPSALDGLLAGAERQRVRAALAGLPPTFREVLVLREIEEMSYRTIADTVGLPVGTVMSRLSRAREALRRALSGAAEDGESDAV